MKRRRTCGGILALIAIASLTACSGGNSSNFGGRGNSPDLRTRSSVAIAVSGAGSEEFRLGIDVLALDAFHPTNDSVVSEAPAQRGPSMIDLAACPADPKLDLVVPIVISVSNLGGSPLDTTSLKITVDTRYGFLPTPWTKFSGRLSFVDDAKCQSITAKTEILEANFPTTTIDPSTSISHTWAVVVAGGQALSETQLRFFLHATAVRVDVLTIGSSDNDSIQYLDPDTTRLQFGYGCGSVAAPLLLEGEPNSWVTPEYAGCSNPASTQRI